MQTALAAAAVILIVIASLFWIRSHPRVETATATLDLRGQSLARGENPVDTAQAPIELSRDVRHLVLDLPVGSKEGAYEVALLSVGSEQLRNATGIARLENHRVILNANINLSGISPGPYFLGVRESGLDWNRYPVHVK